MTAGRRQGLDPDSLGRHYGTTEDLIPLWIAEPDLELAPPVVAALTARAAEGWYGYEVRPTAVVEAFHGWTAQRHGWTTSSLATLVSPSVGTSIGVLIEAFSDPGDGVVLQPPVFTEFKGLIGSAGRTVVRNPLRETDGRYELDLEGLEALAADPTTRILILCNPHNPVGRVWTAEELGRVATICAAHDVFVIADEIHADITFAPHRFTPFATVAEGTGVAWAATHGPIKTFGLAGVCDSLVLTDDERVVERFEARRSQLRLTRNNVFGLTAFETAYREGGPWLDDTLALIAANMAILQQRLPADVRFVEPEGTYLGWLDLRPLGVPVGELAGWLATRAGLAVSPGHWFGREGAGFTRLTLAVRPETMTRAADRLAQAIAERR